MIGVVALFAGFAIEAVVVVIVVLIANLWKVCTCFCDHKTVYICVVSSCSREGREV